MENDNLYFNNDRSSIIRSIFALNIDNIIIPHHIIEKLLVALCLPIYIYKEIFIFIGIPKKYCR